jgi:hypothetical protein
LVIVGRRRLGREVEEVNESSAPETPSTAAVVDSCQQRHGPVEEALDDGISHRGRDRSSGSPTISPVSG